MADYTLQNQMHMLSQMMSDQQARNAPVVAISNRAAFENLPEVFTMADLKAVKGKQYAESSYRSIISRWNSDHLVEEVPAEAYGNDKRQHWRKIVA
jgi:hypothetical protein